MLKTDTLGNTYPDNGGLDADPREEALLKEFPSWREGVENGTMRVSVSGGRTSVEVVSRHFGKAHVPINLEDPSKHEEEFEKLEAQKQIIDAQIAKYPILQQAIEEGWATVRYDHQQGGLGIHVSTAVRSVGVSKLDGLGDVAKNNPRDAWFSSTTAAPHSDRVPASDALSDFGF